MGGFTMDNIEQLELKMRQQKSNKTKAKKFRKKVQAEKRKERKKRTFEKGQIVEQLQAVADPVSPLPIVDQAPRVDKKDDLQKYVKYRAYYKYRNELNKRSDMTSPEDTRKWLSELIKKSTYSQQVLNAFYQSVRLDSNGNLKLDCSGNDYNTILNWYDDEKVGKEYNVIIASFDAYKKRQPQKYRLLLRKLKADPVLLDKI